jgi:iron complex outermembrane receptor protein
MRTSTRIKKNSARVWSAVLWLLPVGPIAAQQQPVLLEEVIVTATKRASRLQDVPAAVSALTSEDIAARGLTQYADFLSSLPGVYFEDGGPGVSQIRIRGLSAAEAGVPPTVATYFGETITSVRTNSGGRSNLRLVDIDRIEVLRGPQGTLFGANALAGVVRIIPAAPDLTTFTANAGVRGSAFEHSSDQSYHVEGTLNMPVVPERFAIRLVGYKDDIAGFLDSEFAGQEAIDYTPLGEALLQLPPGSLPPGTLLIPEIPAFARNDVNSEDTWGGRAAATWQATDRLRFDLSLARQQVTLNSEPFVTPQAGDYLQVRGADAFELGRYGEDMNLASLSVRYDWPSVSLLSMTSWSEMQRDTVQDIASLAAAGLGGVPIPWTLRNDTSGEIRTQEIRLQSSSEGPLSWIFGLLYLEEEADFFQLIRDFSCPACFPSFLGQDFALRADGSFGEEQRAVFGEVSYDISPRWTIGVGARYLEEDVFIELGQVEGFLAPPTANFRQEEPADAFNPSAYLQFKPNEDTTLYLQAARGFRSASPNEPLPAQCQEEAAAVGLGALSDPDTLWNYELGTKSSFADDRVSLNLALYRSQWEGVQLFSSLQCGFDGTLNGGDVKARGVEIELVAQPTSSWRLNASASYNKNEFEEVQEGTGFVTGERLPGSPEKNFALGAQYNFGVGPRWRGFARADYAYVGDVRVVFIGQPAEFLDAYDTANVRIGLQSDNLAIELYGRNLGDERGVVNLASPQQGSTQVIIRPREIGIELRYSYR